MFERGIYNASEGSVASSLQCIILSGFFLMVRFLVCRVIRKYGEG